MLAHPGVAAAERASTPGQTVRANFPHTAFQEFLRERLCATPRILNRAAQAIEAQGFKEGTVPPFGLARSKLGTGALDPEAMEPRHHESIDLDELEGGVARPVVGPPAPVHEIEVRNDGPHIRMAPAAGGQLPNPGADPPHRTP